MDRYEIIVVGAGHAGCEAAYATSHKGHKTLLLTINKKNIADMPCNPSIGGTAKGIVVREIDALGGLMGKVADKSHFQIKMLNNKKGPAVRSLRAQVDKITYPKEMLKALKKEQMLTIKEGIVSDIIVENNIIKGVVLEDGKKFFCKIIILTTGTYLRSNILIGSSKIDQGPHGEKNSKSLSNNLKNKGFIIQRLKTGTPPRIKADSIDFNQMQIERGDGETYTFSFDTIPTYDIDNQQPCFLTYTNQLTHEIINNNLSKSSMYGGFVEGIGPRYCPSIEDKIVRFKDKPRHQLFLEPESLYYDEWYLQGFSTSMPIDVQEKMVHSLKGLEHAVITKYAYAIEYDAIDPLQLQPSLETKHIKNLYTAGQINGTSGYEEAAAQGLIAGINASLNLEKKTPLILKRNEAYIGVLIDDLVTKGTKEPYRLLTSRAEFRLILRHDNADLRLRQYGFDCGLITKRRLDKLIEKQCRINNLIDMLQNKLVKKTRKNNEIFKEYKISFPSKKTYYSELLKRPEINIKMVAELLDITDDPAILEEVQLEVKYEGYIKKANREAERLIKIENKKIPFDIDYSNIKNLSTESRQKLNLVRPITIGQASRISGVNPTDISILAVYLRKEYNND